MLCVWSSMPPANIRIIHCSMNSKHRLFGSESILAALVILSTLVSLYYSMMRPTLKTPFSLALEFHPREVESLAFRT